MKESIPGIEFNKHLNNTLGFSFSKLEDSYSGYNSRTPHRHLYYEMIFFKNEGGVHEIDFNTYPILAGSIHFISPQQVHLVKREKHVKGNVLAFTEDFFLDYNTARPFIETCIFFNNHYAEPVVKLKSADEKKDCNTWIDRIAVEYSSENIDKQLVLQSLTKLLLISCKRCYTNTSGHKKLPFVRSDISIRFKNLLEIEFRKIKSVREYADRLNISPGHLSEQILKDTGRTTLQAIHDRIILESKRLLFHSTMSVKEIAASLHYEDPSYYTKFFKSQTKKSPLQFRSDIREKYH